MATSILDEPAPRRLWKGNRILFFAFCAPVILVSVLWVNAFATYLDAKNPRLGPLPMSLESIEWVTGVVVGAASLTGSWESLESRRRWRVFRDVNLDICRRVLQDRVRSGPPGAAEMLEDFEKDPEGEWASLWFREKA